MSFQTILYGKYFLLDRIAVGGMAEVFKAKTFGVRGFERLLVIKRILPHLSKDEEFVEMFIDEAKIVVELTHANICQVTDLGKIGDNYFIAMEYINGKDLRAILKKCYTAKTPLSVPQALFIAIELLKGLDYAHRKVDTMTGKPLNLIHRDISPQNIMISYHGEVKIVDFGIAKTESKLHKTQAGVLKGKFGYMSPEQASGLELDPRTDIFSCGIILYEMLTGRRLFLGENDLETLEAIKKCVVPSPRKYQPDITPELEAIALKALAKEKENRFDSAQEMLVALSKIFYTSYADFTSKELSEFLGRLFAPEIEQEQEALKRAVDSLPADQLAAAASAAENAGNRFFGSGDRSQSSRPNATRSSSRPRQLTASSPSRPGKKKEKKPFPFLRLLLIFAAAGAAFYFAWNHFHPAAPVEPKHSRETAPAAEENIRITSVPKGAALKIDGENKGETPVSLPLPKGTYRIELEKKGYKRHADSLLVTDDQNTYTFNLEKDLPPIGSLYIDSDPQGAVISYDQTNTDQTTPATIEGLSLNVEHMIRVEMKGFRPAKKNIVLKQESEKMMFRLEKSAVTLKINASPKDARVLLDGKERGQVMEDLEAGKTYALTVDAPGYVAETRKIKPSGTKMELDITLKKQVVETGTVNVGANPWANIIVDGKSAGPSPLLNFPLSVGEHEIIFRHPEYKDVRKKIEIKKGENPPVIHDFKATGG